MVSTTSVLVSDLDTVLTMPAERPELVTAAALDVVREVRMRLADAADPTKAPPMQAYMKSEMPFRGVVSPALKQLCRCVFDARRLEDRSAWRSAVLSLWDGARFREERDAALSLAAHRYYRGYQDIDTLELYRHLVETGAWWDFVDAIASRSVGPILRARFDEVAPTMRTWAVDEHMWVRRTAILCQLAAKAETDPELLTYAVDANLDDSRFGKEFFIRKAVGWALREYAKTDPTWVVDFVGRRSTRLSGLSRREALKNVTTHTA